MLSIIGDYGGGFFTLLITIFTAYLDYRQTTGRYNWTNWKILTIVFLGIAIFISSWIDNGNKGIEKRALLNKIDTLNMKSETLQVRIQVASVRIENMQLSQKKFESVLLREFSIVRDSTSNLPRRINTYNTNIGTAGTVNIGRD